MWTRRAREGIDRGDIAGLLEHLGADCAGAVSILPLDHPPITRPGRIHEDYDPIDEATFAELVGRLATDRPLPDEVRDPSPVAGVRPKDASAIGRILAATDQPAIARDLFDLDVEIRPRDAHVVNGAAGR